MVFFLAFQIFARIPKGIPRRSGRRVVSSLSFYVQRWGVSPNSDPFRQTKMGYEGGVEKVDIFPGCHKCMVP